MAVPKLRFKEFDGDWTKVGLDKISKVFDGTHQTPNYVESGIKFVSVENIHAPYESDKFITEEAFNKDFKNKPEPNDILMTRITAGEIGATAIVDDREPLAYYVSLALIRPTAKVTTPFFKNELHKRIIHVAFPKKINLGDINECLVSCPEKQEEQTKIASFLSNVDEKISQLTQKHELLSQYKQGMMQKLFSQQLRFKADDGSEFGEWENKPLSELSEKAMYGMNASATEYDGLNKYLRITDICEISHKLKRDNLTSPNAELEEKYKLGYGDLLFARTGASVGKSYLYSVDDGIAYFAGFLIKFSLKLDLVNPYFLFAQTLTLDFDKWVITNSMRSGQPGINAEEYSSYIFKVPCLEEQTKIANFLSAIDQKIEVVAQQIEQAKQWKKGLLQQMFV